MRIFDYIRNSQRLRIRKREKNRMAKKSQKHFNFHGRDGQVNQCAGRIARVKEIASLNKNRITENRKKGRILAMALKKSPDAKQHLK